MFVIFGATGRVGTAAAGELLRHGFGVRAVTPIVTGAPTRAPVGCEAMAVDLHDETSVRRALEGAEGVLFPCPLRSSADDVLGEARHITDTVACAIDHAGTGAVVALSAYGAEHPSGTGIATVFHYLELRLRRTCARVTFVRSAERMQHWIRSLPLVRDCGVLSSVHHPLTKLFPIVSARDVGLEAARVLAEADAPTTGEPRVVHMEGPCRYSALDVASTFSALLSRPILAEELPLSAWRAHLVAAGSSESHARLLVELQEAHNAGRIDVERGIGEWRRGHTTFSEELAVTLDARFAGYSVREAP